MFELFLLLILMLIICQIAYVSIKIGISPMPSSLKVCNKMYELSQHDEYKMIIDVGSGFGLLALYFAFKNTKVKIIGYEISYFPWLVSVFLKHIFRCNNLFFYRKNFLKIDFSDDSLIICYLFPKGMEMLEEKLINSGLCVISNTFGFKNRKAKDIFRVNDLYKTPVYVYTED